VRKTVEGRGLAIFQSSLMGRAAFRTIHLTGNTASG
jgi:hypothetical protein